MKIRFIKLKEDPDIKNTRLSRDVSEYYLIGDTFTVFGLSQWDNYLEFYIYNGRHLVLIPKTLVEITDNRVSANWKLKIWEDGGITLWPDLFYQEDFLENFSEWEEKERQQFEVLRREMEG